MFGETFTLTILGDDGLVPPGGIVCSAASLWVPQAFDPGSPPAREQVWSRPLWSGSIDLSAFPGPRVLTLSVALNPDRLAGSGYGSQTEAVDALRGVLQPNGRLALQWTYGAATYSVACRGQTGSFGDQFVDSERYFVASLSFLAAVPTIGAA